MAQQQKTTKTPIQFLLRNGYGKCFSLIERFEPLKHTPYVYTEISFSPRMGADPIFPSARYISETSTTQNVIYLRPEPDG